MSATSEALLTHVRLMQGKTLTNAALLLFGADPQEFHGMAETKCVHCHGTAYKRPFASQQVYSGDLFEQVDRAREFVLARLDRAVGIRKRSAAAPVAHGLPPEAITEAIVNAIAHRDYYSNASVDVRLFADRLEVWNPGSLPATLTPEALRSDHASIPTNPLLAEALYLARYIEKAGSGTQAMIEGCRGAGLPEPDFEQRHGSFVVTLWRDVWTPETIAVLGVSSRQALAVAHVRANLRITNSEYQRISGQARKTSARDLDVLVAKGVFQRVGGGRGAHYVLARRK